MLFDRLLKRCLLKFTWTAAFGDDGLYYFIYGGQMLPYLCEYHRCPPHEHAGVPVIITLFQESFGSDRIGLFGEAIDLINFGCDTTMRLDVAKPGIGPGGPDAEGDELAAFGGSYRDVQVLAKARF